MGVVDAVRCDVVSGKTFLPRELGVACQQGANRLDGTATAAGYRTRLEGLKCEIEALPGLGAELSV